MLENRVEALKDLEKEVLFVEKVLIFEGKLGVLQSQIRSWLMVFGRMNNQLKLYVEQSYQQVAGLFRSKADKFYV